MTRTLGRHELTGGRPTAPTGGAFFVAKAPRQSSAPGVLDATREAEIMSTRRAWARDLKLDGDVTSDVFRAILVMSRPSQRR